MPEHESHIRQSPDTHALRLEVIEADDEFAQLQPEWDELLAQSHQDGPFLRHDWLSAWWTVFGADGQLALVTCRNAATGELLGVLPTFAVLQGRFPRAKALRFLGDTGVGSTGLCAFAHPNAEAPVFDAFAEHLAERRDHWDLLNLEFMDHEHRFVERIAEWPGSETFECGVSPRMSLPGDWESYLGGLTKKWRHEVRRSQRRAEEQGYRPETVTGGEQFGQSLADFMRLHEARMRAKFGPAYSAGDEYRRFHELIGRALLAEDRLRLLFMVQGGERVATLYLFRHGTAMYAHQSGFDEARAGNDALRTLWAYGIRNAIEEGCTSLDMLLGDQRYKRDWGATDLRRLTSVRVYADTLPARLRQGKARVTRLANSMHAHQEEPAPTRG